MTGQSPLSNSKRAFTLIELLTVMVILIILLSVAVPSINKLLMSNGQKQAVNMINAYIASARTTAISKKRPVGVVFFEYENASNYQAATAYIAGNMVTDASGNIYSAITASTGQALTNASYWAPVGHVNRTAIQLVMDDLTNANKFCVAPNNNVEYLPMGIKVSTLVSTASGPALDKESTSINGASSTAATARVILFDGNGQMIMRTKLDSSSVFASNSAWKLDASVNATSSPALLVYSGPEFNDYLNSGRTHNNDGSTPLDATDLENWLRGHADLLVINTFTGNVLR